MPSFMWLCHGKFVPISLTSELVPKNDYHNKFFMHNFIFMFPICPLSGTLFHGEELSKTLLLGNVSVTLSPVVRGPKALFRCFFVSSKKNHSHTQSLQKSTLKVSYWFCIRRIKVSTTNFTDTKFSVKNFVLYMLIPIRNYSMFWLNNTNAVLSDNEPKSYVILYWGKQNKIKFLALFSFKRRKTLDSLSWSKMMANKHGIT